MKILLYSVNFSPELVGIGKYSGEMAASLASQGHQVRVITAPPYYPAWKVSDGYSATSYRRETVDGVGVWRAPIWVPALPGGAARVLHLVTFAISSLPIMLWQLVWSPDVVMTVAPAFVCAPIGWLTARLAGAKAWLHVQDYEVDVAFRVGLLKEGWIGRIVRPVERFLFRRFDVVSSISRQMLQQARTKGVEEQKLRFLPNWVDVHAIKPAPRHGQYRRELGLTEQHTVVLYSGSFGRKHGLMMIPEIARRLRGHPELAFVICGDGAMKDELHAACADLPNTRLLPLQPAERLSELLSMADVHFLPQGEGVEDLVLPSKLSGMVASGRPVIATCRADTEMARVVSGCGVCVEPGNLDALADAVTELAASPERRAELGRRARAYAEEHLAGAAILARLAADLTKLVSAAEVPAPIAGVIGRSKRERTVAPSAAMVAHKTTRRTVFERSAKTITRWQAGRRSVRDAASASGTAPLAVLEGRPRALATWTSDIPEA